MQEIYEINLLGKQVKIEGEGLLDSSPTFYMNDNILHIGNCCFAKDKEGIYRYKTKCDTIYRLIKRLPGHYFGVRDDVEVEFLQLTYNKDEIDASDKGGEQRDMIVEPNGVVHLRIAYIDPSVGNTRYVEKVERWFEENEIDQSMFQEDHNKTDKEDFHMTPIKLQLYEQEGNSWYAYWCEKSEEEVFWKIPEKIISDIKGNRELDFGIIFHDITHDTYAIADNNTVAELLNSIEAVNGCWYINEKMIETGLMIQDLYDIIQDLLE